LTLVEMSIEACRHNAFQRHRYVTTSKGYLTNGQILFKYF